jgi:type VI secretion system protein ImpD
MNTSTSYVGVSCADDAGSDRFRTLAARIDRLIAAIDAALTRQVNVILHAPAFKEMEARWHALRLLVDLAGTGRGVVVRVLDASWTDLGRSLERATDFDQSHLFRLIYDGEFGMPGGLPFGLLVGDYVVSQATDRARGDQVEVLRRLSSVAAAAFCPMIMGAAPETLGYEAFSLIGAESDIEPAPRRNTPDPDRRRWESLRQAEDTRFLGLVAQRVLVRSPYHRYQLARADGFSFDETRDRPLFANGAFAFATTVIAAFLDSGWFAAIRGAYQDAPGGGRAVGFRPHEFGTDFHGLSAQSPIEFRPTAAQEETMIERGLIPLSALYLDPEPVFNANPSLHAPQKYDTEIATQNARLASMLQYVLCTSRFAHYLKVIMRNEIGSVADPSSLQARLSNWLRDYCLGNDDASQDLKAQYPLRDAGVEVSAIVGKPGSYACTVRLQPHFQLDDISTSFHLIAEAPVRPLSERVPA